VCRSTVRFCRLPPSGAHLLFRLTRPGAGSAMNTTHTHTNGTAYLHTRHLLESTDTDTCRQQSFRSHFQVPTRSFSSPRGPPLSAAVAAAVRRRWRRRWRLGQTVPYFQQSTSIFLSVSFHWRPLSRKISTRKREKKNAWRNEVTLSTLQTAIQRCGYCS
jgi:hypothetical protein